MKKVEDKNIPYYVLLDTVVVDVVIALILSIFCFFNMYYIPLGYVLGSVISIANYSMLILQGKLIIGEKPNASGAALIPIMYLLRFALYGVGLFLAFYLEHIGYHLFAWYTVFIAYMIVQIIIYAKYSRKK